MNGESPDVGKGFVSSPNGTEKYRIETHRGGITLNDSIVMKAREMKDMIAATMPEPTVRRRLAVAIPIDDRSTFRERGTLRTALADATQLIGFVARFRNQQLVRADDMVRIVNPVEVLYFVAGFPQNA